MKADYESSMSMNIPKHHAEIIVHEETWVDTVIRYILMYVLSTIQMTAVIWTALIILKTIGVIHE